MSLAIGVGIGWLTIYSAPNAVQQYVKVSEKPNAADIGFAQDMAAHHAQAVEMSILAKSKGGPLVQNFGFLIGDSQTVEIGRFFGWLETWKQPTTNKEPMLWMHEDGHDPSVPANIAMGMASQFEMNRLHQLNGDEFDALFLQLMIRHHQGGVDMANAAIKKANTQLVKHVCKVIAYMQGKEIIKMGGVLKAMGKNPLPYPVTADQYAKQLANQS